MEDISSQRYELADLEPERVRWGDLPNQTMPHAWAETFIRYVHDEHPAVFRAVLPRLYDLPDPEPKRRRS